MKILKLRLFQETACYKKPFALKVAETYPLPPYSTVIGMFHKILQAKQGEYYDMNISVQGDYEGIFSNYQNLRMFKSDGKITNMPRHVHQLLNISLIMHVQAEDEIIDKIYSNIVNGVETFVLGRNEDLVRVDEIKYVNNICKVEEVAMKTNAYIPVEKHDYGDYLDGINYNLGTKYSIDKNNIRRWERVQVKYVEANYIQNGEQDEDGDFIFWYK